MDELKGWLVFAGLTAPSTLGYSLLMHYVFSWPWWVSIPLGITGGFITTTFICLLPLIIWGIVGD